MGEEVSCIINLAVYLTATDSQTRLSGRPGSRSHLLCAQLPIIPGDLKLSDMDCCQSNSQQNKMQLL